jgi:ATP-dependent Zn protease
MKKLFLAARAFAEEENYNEILVEHVLKASTSVYYDINIFNKFLPLNKFNKLNDPDDFFPDFDVDFTGKANNKNMLLNLNLESDFDGISFNKEVEEIIKIIEKEGYFIENEEHVFFNNKEWEKYLEDRIDLLFEVKKLKTYLSQNIFGQDNAINAVVDSIKNNIHENDSSPKHTFFFLGAPGTGKTFMAKLILNSITEYDNFKVFDMAQYQNESDGIQLYGVARGFNNATVGALTSFVRENPKSVIVLDEFEKANIIIQNGLLSIFSGGYLRDACGWCGDEPYSKNNSSCDESKIDDIVDFTKTIVIITSNLGSEIYNDRRFSEIIENDKVQAENMILESIRNEKKDINGKDASAISSPMISRLSQASIVFFNKLKFDHLLSISERYFKSYQKSFKKKYKLDFSYLKDFDDLIRILTLTFSPNLDVRRIKTKLGLILFDHITDEFVDSDLNIKNYKNIKVKLSDDVKTSLKDINKLIIENKIDREVIIKNEVLKYYYSISYDKTSIIFTFEKIYFEKVKVVADYKGNASLTFKMPNKSFDDIAGHEKAKQRLKEIINILKNKTKIEEFNIKSPKGVLLYGPPGTGKTMFASALANEANLPFISTTANDMINIQGLAKEIFNKAKENAPAIILIDEIDAYRKRGTSAQNESYFAPKVNELLTCIDGFDTSNDIFIIAATNKMEIIDPAILRSGRIDIHVEINNLDKEARKYFLEKIILKDSKAKIDVNKFLMYSTGLNGSDLQKIKRESFLYAIRNGLNDINEEILIEQINILNHGEVVTSLSVKDSLEETAFHEAGHAIISTILMPQKKIEQITITPRNKSLGFVAYEKEESYSNPTVDDFKNNICVCLAGRLTQVKRYNDIKGIDTGAFDDLRKATNLAYDAITKYGMDEEFGHINIQDINQLKENFDADIRKRVQYWIKEAEEKTIKLIEENWQKIENLANRLIEEEIIDGNIENIK